MKNTEKAYRRRALEGEEVERRKRWKETRNDGEGLESTGDMLEECIFYGPGPPV